MESRKGFFRGSIGYVHFDSTDKVKCPDHHCQVFSREAPKILMRCRGADFLVTQMNGPQKIGVFIPQIIHLFIGFSLINHPFWGTTIFGNKIYKRILTKSICAMVKPVAFFWGWETSHL